MKILVLDGNSILNRAFYGIKLLTTKNGQYTNGIYGFLNILNKQMNEISPDSVAIAFDMRAKTFRHKMYEGYKANRKGMPPELAQQLPILKEVLMALGYSIIECEGYEADDILGTFAKHTGEAGHTCCIVTGDRDSLQLVSDKVNVYLAATKQGRPVTEIYDRKRIFEEYGTKPEGLIEIKALMGDSSDNIPGVAGIGQKTASSLISKYSNIDNIYDNIDSIEVTPSVRKKLIAGKESAFLSRKLGTIFCDVPIDTDIKSYVKREADAAPAVRILSSLEMFGMIEKLGLSAADIPHTEAGNEEAKPYENCVYAGELQQKPDVGQASIFITDDMAGVKMGGEIYIIPVKSEIFKEILADGGIEKTVFDSKKLYTESFDMDIEIKNIAMDVMLAAYLLNPSNANYEFENLILEYKISAPEIENSKDNKLVTDTACLELLAAVLTEKIEENGQLSLLRDIEIPLAETLADMEHIGMKVDSEGIEQFGIKLEGRLGDITAEIYRMAGGEFNINSPKQLGKVLFEDLRLPVRKKTKTGYSTNSDVLESLIGEHPIIERIMEYRQLSKLKSTYCDGLLKTVCSDGRIHTTFNQTETRTGRISSLEPNLQNIPIRQETGRELRHFFTAADGCVLVDADYSQVELRVLAHMAHDESMIAAFKSGEDIHTVTAAQVFNVDIDSVTPYMRSSAKAVNFGIVYGIGAFSLAKDIGVTRAQATRYIQAYLEKYAGVARYMENVVDEAKKNGYVTTLFGRRRYLPELASSNRNIRNFGERVARNMPIQGTAADIIKISMVKVREKLREGGYKAKLIMQVHDELIIEAPEDEADEVAILLKAEMENACHLSVKLVVDVHKGKTWYDAK